MDTPLIQCSLWLILGASLVAQLVKNPPAMQETWVPSLGWEDPPEKGEWVAFWPGEFRGLSMGSQSRTRPSGFHFASVGNVVQLLSCV